jgi:hypothetical protein
MVSADNIYKTSAYQPCSNFIVSVPESLENPGKVESRTAKIAFEKIVLTKDKEPTRDLRGSAALTIDEHHTGWLHILIYVGQVLNAFFTGKKMDSVNLCHGEVILGVNPSPGKQDQLLLAHGLFNGIKTTSEDHKKDEVITGINIYRPVDERMRDLFAQFAEQTAVNFKKEGIDPKSKDFKSRLRKEVGQFSIKDMIFSVFHKQVIKPAEDLQKQAAFAAADLLKGDKLLDENGNLASYYCTGYLMTLMQGTALVSALSDKEQETLKGKSREEIAQLLVSRIKEKQEGDHLAATYWENEFMQVDARFTMSYFAGEVFDKASGITKG